MASRRILPHTITIFTDIGEDSQYRSQYKKSVHEFVYCKGIAESYSGEKPSNPVTVYIFDSASTNVENFSVKGNGKEYIVYRDASNEEELPSDAKCIRKVVRRRNGTRRMWHWEVYAE